MVFARNDWTKHLGRFQFSIRSLLAFVSACAAAIVFPHVALFALSLVFVILTSRATYRSLKYSQARVWLLGATAFAWIVFYVLSIGPFIAVSEFERKMAGCSYVGLFGRVYRPLVIIGYAPPVAKPLLWYGKRWIPPYATGLPDSAQGNRGANRYSDAPIVGTWTGKDGTVFNCRPDGTGRYRTRAERTIGYFEWTLDADEFAIYLYSSRYSENPIAWFARRVMNDDRPTDCYTVVEMGPARIRLRDRSGGRIISFTAGHDAELESAP